MEITGRVIAKPTTKTGTSQRGIWRKASLIIRYEEGQYPKDIKLINMKKAEEFEKIQIGQTGKFYFDARTTDRGGEWYCDLECWKWELDAPAQPVSYQQGPI